MKFNSLESNIWKYTLLLITNKRVWVSIIAIYYLTVPGVNELGISYILLAGNFAGILFEIPSGYWADIIGHRKTLILSRVFAVISSAFYLFSTSFWHLALGSVFLSLSVAFMSGTGTAFLRSTVNAIGKQEQYPKIMGRIKSLGFLIPLILSTFVPLLVSIDMQLPFVIGLVMDVIGLIVAFLLVEPTVVKVEIKELGIKNIVNVFKESYRIGFLKYAIYTGILGGLIFAISNFRGPYQQSLGADVALFGLFFTAGRLLASMLLWFSGEIQKLFTMKAFFLWQSIFYVIAFLILGLTSNAWVAIVIFAIQNGLKWGLSEIEDSYFIGLIDKSSYKATILSIGSQVQQIIGGIAALYVGYLLTALGYQKGFIYFAISFAIIMFVAYIFTFQVKCRNVQSIK